MKKLLVFGVMAGVFAITGACWAYPSLLGPTGGANLPVAGVIGQGKGSVAFDYINDGGTFDFPDQYLTVDISNTTSLRFLYGVAANTEIGLVYNMQDIVNTFNANDKASNTNWGINAKHVWLDTLPNTSFAVGGVYQSFDTETDTQLYGVATHLFKEGSATVPAIRGTFGVNWTNLDSDFYGSFDAFRPFVDVDLAFTNGLNITAEYQVKADIDVNALSSLVARYPLNKGKTFVGQLGVTNGFRGMTGGENHNVLVGLNYTFGK